LHKHGQPVKATIWGMSLEGRRR